MSATHRRWLTLAAIAGWMVILAACGPGQDAAEPAASVTQGDAAAVRGGTLRVAIPSDVPSFFDWNATKEHELEVIGLVYQPLAAFDRAAQELVPALAASWKVL